MLVHGRGLHFLLRAVSAILYLTAISFNVDLDEFLSCENSRWTARALISAICK